MSDVPLTTPGLVDRAAERHGDRAFLIEDGVSLSYREFRLQARRVAAAVIARGIAPGDRVAIWAPNSAAWVIAALGAQYAGATLVTINSRFKAAEAAQVLEDSGTRLLFSVGTFLDTDYPAALRPVIPPCLETVVVLGETTAPAESWDAFLAGGEAVDAGAVDARRDGVTADSISDIIFTSGTTGRAKGVITAHGQNVRAFSSFAGLLGLQADDRYLVINPFFHSFGYKAGILAILCAGCTLYPMAVFDTARVLAAIERHRVTVMPGPPALFQSLLTELPRQNHDVSSLSKATTGASTIPVALIRRMHSELGIDTVLTAYGLSEASGIVTMCRRGDSAETIARTSGRPLPGVEVRIVDDAGRSLPAGAAGEVQVQGFNLMQGYFADPAATAEAFTADGWLRTGDVGVLDGEGNLQITDRLKDMFICGGFNCYPAEIENTLAAHPAIASAAVIGAPDERLGEVAHAFAVLRPGCRLDEAELIAWCRERMANYKVPRGATFLDALPLNAAGKVLKTTLRERLAHRQGAA